MPDSATLAQPLVNSPSWTLQDTSNPGTYMGASHAETANDVMCGVVTTEALSTASGATEVRTLTSNQIVATSRLFVHVTGGTNTTQGIIVTAVPGNGSATVNLYNANASPLNGTVTYTFLIL